MRQRIKRAPFSVGAETRFQVEPNLEANPTAKTDELLEQFKNRLMKQQEVAEENDGALPTPALRRAANEAAALAWLTPYPLLLLPGLFEEKVAAAKARSIRQESVRRRSQRLVAEAA